MRDRPEQQPERHPEAERQRVDLAERPQRVAEERRDLLHARTRGDDADLVAELERHRRVGDEVDVSAAHARGGRAEALVEAELSEPAARDRLLGHGDAAEIDVAAVELRLLVALEADLRDHLLHGGVLADDRQEVSPARMQIRRGGHRVAVANEPAERHRLAMGMRELGQRR